MEWNTFIKESCFNNIHTKEKIYVAPKLKGVLDVYFPRESKHLYFGFYHSSLDLWRTEDHESRVMSSTFSSLYVQI